MQSNTAKLFFVAIIFNLLSPFHSRSESSTSRPNIEEAKREIQTAVPPEMVSKVVVREVFGCYPMKDHPRSDRLCLIDLDDSTGEFRVQQLPFQKNASGWKLLNPRESYSLDCPTAVEALPLFREAMHDDKVVVKDVPDEGTVTDERGMSRDKKGPLRLMCTYGLEGRSGEYTVIGYFRFENDSYKLDSDKEVWY